MPFVAVGYNWAMIALLFRVSGSNLASAVVFRAKVRIAAFSLFGRGVSRYRLESIVSTFRVTP